MLKIINFVGAVLAVLLLISGAAAQNAADKNAADWSNVAALSNGQMVIVKTKTNWSFRGTINQISLNSLIVTSNKRLVTFERDEIIRVYTAKRSKGLRILGGVIGAVGGLFGSAAIFAAGAEDDEEASNGAALIALGATFGGAVIGSKIGYRWRKDKLVYQVN